MAHQTGAQAHLSEHRPAAARSQYEAPPARSVGRGAGRWGASAVAIGLLLGAVACGAAGPPKAPPPPIQEGLRDVGTPVVPAVAVPQAHATVQFVPGQPAAQVAPIEPRPSIAPINAQALTPGPSGPPTPPAIVAQAVAAAPAPPGAVADEAALPTARELATGMIAALDKARTARLAAKLPNGHTTDLQFVAPDRASLVERDVDGQEYARYVIIDDTGYVLDSRGGTGWRKVVNDGYRKQTQIFRPMQIALATGEPRPLASGTEVELTEANGKPAIRAMFEYGSSPELQDLGLMRSTGNLLEVVVDPATWLPIRTREEAETGGGDKAITEVSFVGFDQPATVEAPIS
jgi:hypothetical protein